MEELKPNSNRYHEESVVQNSVSVKKKSNFDKFIDAFIAEDIESVGNYMIYKFLIPKAKEIIIEGLTKAVNSIFNGIKDGSQSSGTVPAASANYKPYNRTISISPQNQFQQNNYYRNGGYIPQQAGGLYKIAFATKEDAESVLNRMREVLEHRPYVSVAQYYDFAGVSSIATYTDEYYGWYTLNGVYIPEEPNADKKWEIKFTPYRPVAYN